MNSDRSLSRPEKAKRKVIAVGGRAFFGSARLAYRLRWPWRGKLRAVDHVTVPCANLPAAEDFYVGLLGARVLLRMDAAKLIRMGWTAEQVQREHAVHLSVTFGRGPRLDIFEAPHYDPHDDSPHPHIALAVAPGKLLDWKRRLTEHGVRVAGPARLGPPGQASCYFNDPFGNHLELVTIGFTDQDVPIGPPDRANLDHRLPTSG